tara:strand:- start:261 stop:425 length:165 start_codon:yes stop_codon:yes gene_type:complete
MQVGDLVYVPYFGDYAIIVKRYRYVETADDCWVVFYSCGNHSCEYEDDMELICK